MPATVLETKFEPCSGLVVASPDLRPTTCTDSALESHSLAFELCRWVAHRVFLPLLQLKRRWVWRLCHVRHEMPPLPVPGGLDFDAWQRPAGDGLCELHSQTHPHVGRSIVDGRLERVAARALPAALATEFSRIYGAISVVADADTDGNTDAGDQGTLGSADDAHACLRPGHWYSHQLPCDHLDIVPFPRCLKKQHAFFDALFRVIQSLPSSGLAAPVSCAF
jgi:hypothetical protein